MYAIDYANDASTFAVAGEDFNIYVYNTRSNKLASKPMNSNGLKVEGHSRRIRCVKYFENDNNILLTGGWDGIIKIYDLRVSKPVAQILGPYLNSDSIDCDGDNILAGSY